MFILITQIFQNAHQVTRIFTTFTYSGIHHNITTMRLGHDDCQFYDLSVSSGHKPLISYTL